MTDLLIRNARLLEDDAATGSLSWLLLEDGRIRARGTGAEPSAAAVHDAQGSLVTPGFVDIHCHGGGGFSGEGGPQGIRGAAAFHRSHGTTSIVLSLATAPVEVLLEHLSDIAMVAEQDQRVLGAHLEGPFLSAEYRGAHDESLLCAPTPQMVQQILAAARGYLRQVTLAPEHAADAVIQTLVAAGVRVAVGHTAATWTQATDAFARGASILTHAFNAMPGIHHREPGPILAAWRDAEATIELIADGVHVHPEVIAMLFALAPHRIALITDAIAAAGAPDGEYPLGAFIATVRDGIARIGTDGPLAGSTLTVDRAVRTVVSAGVPVATAIHAATLQPALALGLTGQLGRLQPGLRADLVQFDDDLHLTQVWSQGRPVDVAAAG
jgi:N-acetylglucosamine-6-phosphate deacetylase